MRSIICFSFAVFFAWSCRSSVIVHDENSAAQEAARFAFTAFVRQDARGGYSLLADSAKRQLTFEQFKAVNEKLHPSTFPTRVVATEFEPIPGQDALNIFLFGQSENESFYYRIPVEGSLHEGYKVSGMYRGNGLYPPSNLRQQLKAEIPTE